MAEELKSSEISKFYDGKNVFITGATGKLFESFSSE